MKNRDAAALFHSPGKVGGRIKFSDSGQNPLPALSRGSGIRIVRFRARGVITIAAILEPRTWKRAAIYDP